MMMTMAMISSTLSRDDDQKKKTTVMGDNHSSNESGNDNDPYDGNKNTMVMIMTKTSLNKKIYLGKGGFGSLQKRFSGCCPLRG